MDAARGGAHQNPDVAGDAKPHPSNRKKEKRRREMTLVEKMQVVVQAGRGKSQRELAREYNVGLGTINGVLKRRQDIVKAYEANDQQTEASRKRHQLVSTYGQYSGSYQRKTKNEQLNAVVWEWYTAAKSKQVPISGVLLQRKALELAKKLPGNEGFKASNGWLHSFSKRHRISFGPDGAHGETQRRGASAKSYASWLASRQVKEWIKDYLPRDIFACTETTLLPTCLPDEVRSVTTLTDDSDRLTLLLVANSLGEKELPVVIAGPCASSVSSPSSKGIRSMPGPASWKLSPQGWITSTIFFEWLEQFDSKMREQNRRVILFVPATPCHPIDCQLENVAMYVFPCTINAEARPLHSEIVSTMKRHFRAMLLRWQYARMHDPDEPTRGSRPKQVDRYMLDHWVRKAWENTSVSAIVSSFGVSKVQPRLQDLASSLVADMDAANDLHNLLQLVYPAELPVSAAEFSSFDNAFPVQFSFDGDDWEDQLIQRSAFLDKQDEIMASFDPSALQNAPPPGDDPDDVDGLIGEPDDCSVAAKSVADPPIISSRDARKMLDTLRHFALQQEPTLLEPFHDLCTQLDERIAHRALANTALVASASADVVGVSIGVGVGAATDTTEATSSATQDFDTDGVSV